MHPAQKVLQGLQERLESPEKPVPRVRRATLAPKGRLDRPEPTVRTALTELRERPVQTAPMEQTEHPDPLVLLVLMVHLVRPERMAPTVPMELPAPQARQVPLALMVQMV